MAEAADALEHRPRRRRRSFAALAGWEVAGSTFSPAPILLAAVLFLWTPSHFWSFAIVLERDYRAAGLPMLSAVAGAERTARAVVANTAALVATSIALAAPAGLGFLTCTVALVRHPDTSSVWRAFKLSGLYLLVLLVGLALAGIH